jgi:hypothetical protein
VKEEINGRINPQPTLTWQQKKKIGTNLFISPISVCTTEKSQWGQYNSSKLLVQNNKYH